MSKNLKYSLLIIALGLLFFIPFLGGVHLFDWDEINFAEISREMIIGKNYLRPTVNFMPFWEKPPLFFWLQVLSMKALGINEFAARLPNAVIGIITLLVIFQIGRRFFNPKFAFIWVLVYIGSILPFFYFKSGIIDPLFNFFIFLSLYFFILFHWKRNDYELAKLKWNKWTYLIISGVFMGLAMLTKGQAAFIIFALCAGVYFVYKKFRFYVNVPQVLVFILVAAFVASIWFGLETLINGTWFVKRFFVYQYELFTQPVAGHQGFLAYHFVVLLFGCFPASVFALRAFKKYPAFPLDYQKDFMLWMKILFWMVLILFSIVSTKIVHYSSLTYLPLTFLAAFTIWQIIENKISFSPFLRFTLLFTASILLLAVILLPVIGMNADFFSQFIQDTFTKGNLQANVRWGFATFIPALFLILILIGFLIFIRKKNFQLAFYGFLLGMALFTFATIITFIGRVEAYSQNAAIEFYKKHNNEKAYFVTYGFHSYAPYFYGKVLPHENENFTHSEWLLNQKTDKTVYVISKVPPNNNLINNNKFEKLYEKNGFVFFRKLE